MKIDDTLNKTVAAPTLASPQQARADTAQEAPAAAPPAPPSTTVQLSPLSTQLQALQSTQASSSVFATKKVEEIKLAISEGRFQVNSEKVADGLLESVKDLINSRKR
ncbi:flagellar biosynthesis anti-sigma factor FlgM [Undibacterium sp. SXout20W]|uniref:flagellar biosynthesis anti-sigma factor FlgM n=1 Tax=Undibacterium sp. SXout20W TaxID=3413051 RepID=UPI003BF27D26